MLLLLVALSGCGRSENETTSSSLDEVIETPAATGTAEDVTWATYRNAYTVDPVQAFDYPESTVISVLCDSIIRQNPDLSLGPAIAKSTDQPNPTTIILNIDERARFWNGDPVTADDVAFSINRQIEGGFAGTAFVNIDSVRATDPQTVTIKLSQRDNWLLQSFSAAGGAVVQREFVEQAGDQFGSARGGTMCSGPFELGEWKPGSTITVEANEDYWDPELIPMTESITFRGVADEAALTSGLLTGEIDGVYPQPLSSIDRLKEAEELNVYGGPSLRVENFVPTKLDGILGDVRVRQAISLALDREAYIGALHRGEAEVPRGFVGEGSWGFAREAFAADWESKPELEYDVERAKELIKEAGVEGETLTLGTTTEIGSINTATSAIRTAAIDAGLKVKLESVSADEFISYFTREEARASIDGLASSTYLTTPDPAAYYSTIVAEGGAENYSGYEDAELARLLEASRGAESEEERAKLTIEAGDRMLEELPWIPMALPKTILVMRNEITGAPASFQYMAGPWAATLGSSG